MKRKIYVKNKVWEVENIEIKEQSDFRTHRDPCSGMIDAVVGVDRTTTITIDIQQNCCTRKLFKWFDKKFYNRKEIDLVILMRESPRETMSVTGTVDGVEDSITINVTEPIEYTVDVDWDNPENDSDINVL